mgnify:CR=1 FL=1
MKSYQDIYRSLLNEKGNSTSMGKKGHSGTVDFTGQGMSFLLIWKCSRDKVMILRDIKTDRNDIYLIYCYLF